MPHFGSSTIERTGYTRRPHRHTEVATIIHLSDQLSFKGGMMVVYKEQCIITLHADLTETEQAQGINEMLSQRKDLQALVGGFYIWQLPSQQN